MGRLSVRILAVLALNLSFFGFLTAQNHGCAYDGRVFVDAALNLNSDVCQQCVRGKWVDKTVPCDKCKTANVARATNPTPLDSDCTAKHPGSVQNLTFSDGARVHRAGNYQRCSAGQWVNSEPVKDQICERK
jgi:hypothetical protein